MAKDKVIMCHDDIEVLASTEVFNKVIDDNMTDKNWVLRNRWT